MYNLWIDLQDSLEFKNGKICLKSEQQLSVNQVKVFAQTNSEFAKLIHITESQYSFPFNQRIFGNRDLLS